MNHLKIKRIYQNSDDDDGLRVLVDGLWPRGIRKEDAHIDLWLKEVAPSAILRKWYNHEPEKWREFCARYTLELDEKKEHLRPIRDALHNKNVTLLYASKEEHLNNAAALKAYLLKE